MIYYNDIAIMAVLPCQETVFYSLYRRYSNLFKFW